MKTPVEELENKLSEAKKILESCQTNVNHYQDCVETWKERVKQYKEALRILTRR